MAGLVINFSLWIFDDKNYLLLLFLIFFYLPKKKLLPVGPGQVGPGHQRFWLRGWYQKRGRRKRKKEKKRTVSGRIVHLVNANLCRYVTTPQNLPACLPAWPANAVYLLLPSAAAPSSTICSSLGSFLYKIIHLVPTQFRHILPIFPSVGSKFRVIF